MKIKLEKKYTLTLNSKEVFAIRRALVIAEDVEEIEKEKKLISSIRRDLDYVIYEE